jgi:hypothetical protein
MRKSRISLRSSRHCAVLVLIQDGRRNPQRRKNLYADVNQLTCGNAAPAAVSTQQIADRHLIVR